MCDKDTTYISRMHYGGWFVRIKPNNKEKLITRYFPDQRYNGQDQSFQAAKAFRDETLHNLGRLVGDRPVSLRGKRTRMRNNNSGIIRRRVKPRLFEGGDISANAPEVSYLLSAMPE